MNNTYFTQREGNCSEDEVEIKIGEYIPVATSNVEKKSIIYLGIKRVIDIIGSLCGLCFLPFIAVCVKIGFIATGNKDSIWFRQPRIGKDGKIFCLYKFQTMMSNADDALEEMLAKNPELRREYELNKKLPDDFRVTKIGRILRKTSIDEIPQLINVFKGDMSLIGNRPYMLKEINDMGDSLADIVSTKPGISGLWQTSGRSNIPFNERVAIESQYSKQCSLGMDIKLFLKTFLIVFKQEGAH